MSKPHYAPAVIGTTVNEAETEVAINLDALIGSHAIAMANSGGGKTGLIRKLLESTHGQIQQIVLDVEDEFYTLREKFDYLVAGGANGDCPATPENAKDLATMLLTHGISAVIQLNDLKTHQQEEFVRLFLEAMMEAPRALWHPVLVVLDEAQRLAPQDGSATCGPAVQDLMARGRKRGFTAILATVRNSRISKDVTGMVNNWFMGRVGQATDRRVAADALGFSPTSADGRSLQTMPARTFWAFGPAVSTIPIQFKVDPVKTTILKAGEAKVMSLPAPAAMRKLLAEMAKAAQKAQESGKSTKAATMVAGTPVQAAPGPSQAEIEAIRSEAYRSGVAEGRSEGFKEVASKILAEMRPIMDRLDKLAHSPDLGEVVMIGKAASVGKAAGLAEVIADHQQDGTSNVVKIYEDRPTTMPAGFKPSAPQQRIIDALASWQSFKEGPVEKVTLAFLAEASSKSSGYANNLGALRSAGVIVYPAGGMIDLTADGRALAAPAPKKLSNDAVQRAVLERLSRPERRIVEALIEVWPDGISRERLAERVDASPSSSGFANNLGKLRSLGIIDYPTPGQVQATKMLFPFGAA